MPGVGKSASEGSVSERSRGQELTMRQSRSWAICWNTATDSCGRKQTHTLLYAFLHLCMCLGWLALVLRDI